MTKEGEGPGGQSEEVAFANQTRHPGLDCRVDSAPHCPAMSGGHGDPAMGSTLFPISGAKPASPIGPMTERGEMTSAYNALLNEVCVRLGFCGAVVDGAPCHVDLLLPEHSRVSADAFATLVFRAGGWDPDGPGAHEFRRPIRDAFVRHMGAAEVDVALLR
jgi:hypothetical protein